MRTIMSQWITKILNREWTRRNANEVKMSHEKHERHEKGGMLLALRSFSVERSPGTADRLIGCFFVRVFFSLRSLRLIPSGSLKYRTDPFRTNPFRPAGDVL